LRAQRAAIWQEMLNQDLQGYVNLINLGNIKVLKGSELEKIKRRKRKTFLFDC
jgi:hypothetical protein